VLLAISRFKLCGVRSRRQVFADMLDSAWAIAFAKHLARCGGDASIHTARSWLVKPLAEIVSKVRGALGVGVEVLKDPTMLV
jgi:hypothetical protein